ncbi:MAG TPA: hypothetical protein VH044_15760, partial [Polyangiaceae bacterium]|nr:hypothetical protein [Polyangiaceae bacterium]
AAALGCHSTDSGTIQIIVDDEAGTFTESPAPTELQVLAVQSADASTVLATAQLPTSTIDLGNLDEGAPTVSINVTGYDATHARRVFGATLPLQYGLLAGQTVPVFVQRTGEFARLPGPLSDARQQPTLAILQGEYLLVAGGTEASWSQTTQLFDFGAFSAFTNPPTLPTNPDSLALAGTVAWLVNAAGATYFDFSISEYVAVPAPAGGSFADVAGGATIVDDSGVQYIVGATRMAGAATTSVLKVDPNDATDTNYPYGKPTWLTLTTPRLGAAATWVPNRGLVIVGGNTDPSAAGSEVIAPTTSTGMALPFAADFTMGAGAALLDATHVLLAGGISATLQDPGTRALDLNCASLAATCVVPWQPLPVVLASAQAFTWNGPADALVVGNEFGSGTTHVFRLTPMTSTEVPTRTPHANARAVWSPVGSIALFGGSPVIESFTP